MYNKNLTEDFRLRLSSTDMEFLRSLSDDRSMSVSEVVRSIIGEYRRSLDTVATLQQALALVKEGGLSCGDIKTELNDKL